MIQLFFHAQLATAKILARGGANIPKAKPGKLRNSLAASAVCVLCFATEMYQCVKSCNGVDGIASLNVQENRFQQHQ